MADLWDEFDQAAKPVKAKGGLWDEFDAPSFAGVQGGFAGGTEDYNPDAIEAATAAAVAANPLPTATAPAADPIRGGDFFSAITAPLRGNPLAAVRGLVDRGADFVRGIADADLFDAIQRGTVDMAASGIQAGGDFIDRTVQQSNPLRTLGEMAGADVSGLRDPLGVRAAADQAAAVNAELTADRNAVMADLPRPSITDFFTDPADATRRMGERLATQGTESVPAFALALASRNPEVGARLLGGVSGVQDYADLTGDGVDPRTAIEAAALSAAVEAAGEGFSLPKVMAKGPMGGLLDAMLVEGGQELPVSIAQTNIQDQATGNATPIAEQLLQGLEAAASGAGLGLGGYAASNVPGWVAGRDSAPTTEVAPTPADIVQAMAEAAPQPAPQLHYGPPPKAEPIPNATGVAPVVPLAQPAPLDTQDDADLEAALVRNLLGADIAAALNPSPATPPAPSPTADAAPSAPGGVAATNLTDWIGGPNVQRAPVAPQRADTVTVQPYQPQSATRDNPLPRERMQDAPVGSWVRGPDVPGVASNLFEIRNVPLDKLVLPEVAADGSIPSAGRDADVAQYAERMKAGTAFPNARGYELADGRVKIADGHRRAMAAKRAGLTSIPVAVSPQPGTAPTPVSADPAAPSAVTATDKAAGQPTPKPKRVRKVDPTSRKPMDLLQVLAATGGLNREAFRKQGVDPAEFQRRYGINYLFRKNGGRTLSELREFMQQEGYLQRDDEFAQATVDDNDALDLFDRAFRGGEEVYSLDQEQDVAAYRAARKQADDEFQAELAGDPEFITPTGDPDEDARLFNEMLAHDSNSPYMQEVSRLTERAYDLGADDGHIIDAAWDSDHLFAPRQLVARLENENDVLPGAEAGDSPRGPEPRQEAEPAAGFSLQGQFQDAAPARQEVAPQAGLFGAPTGREYLDAATRAKDAARDGRSGTGRTDMAAGDGELFAGNRPAQARVDDSRATAADSQPTSEASQPEPTPEESSTVAPADPMAAQRDLFDRLRAGEATLDEYKAGWQALQANRDAIRTQLEALKKDALVQLAGPRYRNENKAALVKSALSEMESDYAIGRGVSWSMGESLTSVYAAMVERTTDADLKAYADKVAASREARKQRVAGAQDPQTLSEFEDAARLAGGESKLTPAQRERFDALRVQARKEQREATAKRNAEIRRVDTGDTGMELVETTHTQKGHALFVVKMAERVEAETYKALNAAAKRLGGYYSSFRGNGAIPGFTFTSREAAEQFMAVRSGNVDSSAQQEARQSAKDEGRADTLASKAAALREKAKASLNRERKDNTARRAAQAASAEESARRDLAMAGTMDRIAQAIETGDASLLRYVRHRTQVELFERLLTNAHWDYLRAQGVNWEKAKDAPISAESLTNVTLPGFEVSRGDAVPMVRALLTARGGKQLGQAIQKMIDYGDEYGAAVQERPYRFVLGRSDGGTAIFKTKREADAALSRSADKVRGVVVKLPKQGFAVALAPELAIERKLWAPDYDKKLRLTRDAAQKAADLLGTGYGSAVPNWWAVNLERRAALDKLGIETHYEYRQALREYLSLREQPAEADRVRKLERDLAGRNVGVDFFPTPPAVVSRIVEQADIGDGMRVLEPSAGKGDIAEAIRDSAEGVTVEAAEVSGPLREILEAKGFDLIGHDFMELQPTPQYDRVVMNPPFLNDNGAAHVRHAFKMLKPGGRLVAVMGTGSRGKAEFEAWLDEVGGIAEPLPEGSFKSSFRPTGVATQVVVIDKAGVALEAVEPQESFDALQDQDVTDVDPATLTDAERAAFGLDDRAATLRSAVDAALGEVASQVQYLRSWRDLPQGRLRNGVESRLKQRGGEGQTAALFDPKTGDVYLFTDANPSPERAVFNALHEIAGHKGLRALLGKDLDKALDLAAQNPTVLAVAEAIALERGIDASTDAGQRLAVEEALAELAAAVRTGNYDLILDRYGVTVPQGIRERVAAAVANFLRRLKALLDGTFGQVFSDADVRALLENAWQAAQGNAETAGDTAEATAPDQTKTPEFRRWFGDSKVVDENGKPLVVYHGTTGNFDVFDMSRAGEVGDRFAEAAFFTSSPVVAAGYAQRLDADPEHADLVAAESEALSEWGRAVLAQYAATKSTTGEIADPKRAVADGIQSRRQDRRRAIFTNEVTTPGANVMPVYLSLQNPHVIDAQGANYHRVHGDAIAAAIQAGADGVIIRNVFDSANEVAREASDVYVAFRPEQIKSATANRGTFDPDSPSILESVAEAEGRAEQRRNEAAGELPVSRGTPGWHYDESRWEGRAGAAKRARMELQDKMLAWRDVQNQVEGQIGRAIPDAQNVYRAETLMHGRVAERLDRIERDEVKPLLEAMKAAKVSPETLEEYLYARHAKERNAKIAAINPAMPAGGSGMADAEADAILSNADRARLDPLAARVDAITRANRRRLLGAGLITQEAHDAMAAQYQHYVPLRGKPDTTDLGGTAGRGIDTRRQPVKQALGRRSRAANILGEVIGDAQRGVILAEKARVGKAVMRLVLANPNPDLWTVEPVQTERALDANGEVYERVVNDWSDPSVVAVRVAGKLYKVQIQQPQLAQALNNVGVDQLGAVTRAAGAINRYFSAVLTKYNPAFVPVNATRDALFGLTGLAVEKGEAVALDAALHYPQAILAAGKHAAGASGSGQWDQWAREFAEAGGKTGYVAMPSVEDLQRQVANVAVGGSKARLVGAVKPLVDTIGAMNDAVENALRLSAYVSLRKRGESAEAAAEYAKNLTVNFNRKGFSGSKLNAWFLFYNAALQGAHRTSKLLRNPKTYAYLGALAGAQVIAAMFAMGLEDDEGEPLWNKVPDHVKRRNLVIVHPSGTIVTVPMPYGFNLFTYMAGRSVDALMSKERKASNSAAAMTADLLSAASESFVPVPIGDGALGFLPTVLRIPTNIQTNRNDFGRAIRTEQPYAKSDVPRASMGRPDTLEVFKLTATGLNRLGGGDAFTPPPLTWFDFAPEDLEYLMGELTGGTGKFVVDLATVGQQATGGKMTPDLEAKDIPITKRFVTNIDEQASQRARFYERRESIDRGLKRVRNAYRTQGPEAAETLLASMPELSGASFKRRKRDSDNGEAGSIIEVDGAPQIIPSGDDTVFGAYKAAEKAMTGTRESIEDAFTLAPASLLPTPQTRQRDASIRTQQTQDQYWQSRFNALWVRDVVGAAEKKD